MSQLDELVDEVVKLFDKDVEWDSLGCTREAGYFRSVVYRLGSLSVSHITQLGGLKMVTVSINGVPDLSLVQSSKIIQAIKRQSSRKAAESKNDQTETLLKELKQC